MPRHQDSHQQQMKQWAADKAKWYADNKAAVAAIWAGLNENQRAAFVQRENGDNWVSNSAVLQGDPPVFGSAAVPDKTDRWAAGTGTYTDADLEHVWSAMAKVDDAKPPRPKAH